MSVDNNNVALNFTGHTKYYGKIPFNPPEAYPEYTGKDIDPDNYIYADVRNTLIRLGLDKKNINTKEWNPLGSMIKPGMHVFIKPNTVRHYHLEHKDHPSTHSQAFIIHSQ